MTAGSSITPVSVSFTGSVNGAFLQVTSVSSGSIELGAEISGPGVRAGSTDRYPIERNARRPRTVRSFRRRRDCFIGNDDRDLWGAYCRRRDFRHGRSRGAGYRRWRSSAHGDRRQSERQRPRKHLGCQQRPNGRGRKHDDDGDSPHSRLGLDNKSIVGATANNDFFDVSPNGDFGYDHNPSSLSYMSGTAAAALGLTQASGAINSSPGGQQPSVSEFMNNLVQNENSQFGSFQNIIGSVRGGL